MNFLGHYCTQFSQQLLLDINLKLQPNLLQLSFVSLPLFSCQSCIVVTFLVKNINQLRHIIPQILFRLPLCDCPTSPLDFHHLFFS